jgi:hypothetical protein
MYRHSIGQIVRDGNRVGDDPKSSKTINAEENAFDFRAMSFTGNSVANDSRFALAA